VKDYTTAAAQEPRVEPRVEPRRSPTLGVLFWTLIAATVASVAVASSYTRQATWQGLETAAFVRQQAAERAQLVQQIEATRSGSARLEAEVARLEVQAAALADEGLHLRVDRSAGTVELVQDGFTLRRSALSEGAALSVGGAPLAAGEALPVSAEDAAAMRALLDAAPGEVTRYVW
jgi:hypothetical protein